jgi:hypothetical protein
MKTPKIGWSEGLVGVVEMNNEDSSDDSSRTAPHQMAREWLPRALHRTTLLAFTSLFALLAIALGVIFRISDEQHGLVTPTVKYRYLWTYTPSTLFIVVSGLWVLVDYNTRSLAPWRAMAAGPTSLTKSLDVDYISSNHYAALYRSSKNSHWDVAIAAAGTICLDLLVVLSTGLFVLQPTHAVDPTHRFPISTQVNFTGQVQSWGKSFSTAYAMRLYGLSPPVGSTADYAYTSIDASGLPSNVAAKVVVDAIRPDISCEVANASWAYGVSGITATSKGVPGSKISIISPGCNLTYTWPLVTTNSPDNYLLTLAYTNCSAQDGFDGRIQKFTVLAGRMTLTGANFTTTRQRLQNATREDVKGTGVEYFIPISNQTLDSEVACVVCSMRYHQRKASVMISDGTWTSTLVDSDSPPDGFPIIRQSNNFTKSLESTTQLAITSGLMADGGSIPNPGLIASMPAALSIDKWSSWYAPFFKMLNQTDPRPRVRDLVDQDFILKSVPSTLQLITTQYISDSLFPKAQGGVMGEYIETSNRLIVSSAALGLVIGVLSLLTFVSIVLCVRSKGATTREPMTVAGKATILSRSSDVMSHVRQNGIHEETSYHVLGCPNRAQSLKFQTFSVDQDGQPTFFIRAHSTQNVSCNCDEQKVPISEQQWWQPWSSSIWCHIRAIILPCTIIAILEGLYRRSQNERGIAAFNYQSFAHYFWVYIPVLVVVAMNTIFSMASSTNRIIQPYIAMRRRPCQTSEALAVDFVHKSTVGAMWLALKLKHFGTASAIFATILGATLPITISGLYRMQTMEFSRSISLQQLNGFNGSLRFTGPFYKTDFYPVPGFILYQNLSYPQWTHGKYALPAISAVDPAKTATSFSNGTVNVELPAVFSVANCSLLSQSDVTFSAKPPIFSSAAFLLNVKLDMKNECPPLTDTYSLGSRFFAAYWQGLSAYRRNNGTVAPSNPKNDTRFASFHGSLGVPQHCPLSLAFIAKGSYVNRTGELILTDSMAFGCSPYVAQEKLNVTFSLPDFNISSSQPPSTVPDTQTVFSEAEILNAGEFMSYLPVVRTAIDPKVPGLSTDVFFQAMFGGVDGILPSEMLSADNKTLLSDDATIKRLQKRMEKLYGIIVAQLYDGKQRSANFTQNAPGFNGTFIPPAGARVVQDEISTRILQAVLAAMTVCAIVSMFMIDAKQLLPRSPCSIAAVATLLANSSVLSEDMVPLGAELLNQDELKQQGIFEYYLYSLGWWGNGDTAWYGIDVGKAEKEEDRRS